MPVNKGAVRRREEAAAEHLGRCRDLISRVEDALKKGEEVRITFKEREIIGLLLNELGMTLVDDSHAKKRVHRRRRTAKGIVLAETENGQLERRMLLRVHTRHRDERDDLEDGSFSDCDERV